MKTALKTHYPRRYHLDGRTLTACYRTVTVHDTRTDRSAVTCRQCRQALVDNRAAKPVIDKSAGEETK